MDGCVTHAKLKTTVTGAILAIFSGLFVETSGFVCLTIIHFAPKQCGRKCGCVPYHHVQQQDVIGFVIGGIFKWLFAFARLYYCHKCPIFSDFSFCHIFCSEGIFILSLATI